MPSLRDLVRDWHRGAQAVARGNWGSALRLFSDIREPRSRMCFNMGCVHLLAGDPEVALQVRLRCEGAASQAFDQAVTKDTCLAVSFFQRGVANFQLERFQEALSDFRLALAQLRGNPAIDYTQLGLRFKLKAWEHTPALTQPLSIETSIGVGGGVVRRGSSAVQLGLWAQATCSLQEAISTGLEGSRNHLDAAWDHVQKQVSLQLWQVPRGEVFRPHRQRLEHLEPVDFLGKVVASAVPDDQHEGAQPQQSQAPAEPATPVAPGCPPDTETEVSSGQVEQAGHCEPVTYAEQGVASGDPESLVPITVQGTFTLALQAPRADLSSLRALLSQALAPQARCGQLRVGAPGQQLEEAGVSEVRPSLQVLTLVQVVSPLTARSEQSLCMDQAWLEGHLDGRVGIFCKCFVAPASQCM
ncbi:hypothetical protein MC885_004529 [Smutsia gigantea]|nr:hypothetical protein MC885_004529 [Smutsia gigantea]